MSARGPKTELVLQRYTLTPDGGGGQIKTWSAKRKIRGVLTFVGADERVRADKETLHERYQFWCSVPKGLNITTKDEFSRTGSTFRYRIVEPDDILERGHILKIDLIRIK